MRMRGSISVAVGLVVVVTGTPLQAQLAPAARQIVGCYILRIGIWTSTIGDEAAYYTPSDSVRLHTDHRVTPTLRYSPSSAHRASATWQLADADSVVLVWTNGFAVARLALHTGGGGLRGTLEAISDSKPMPTPPARTAPVTARRIECRES